MKRPSILSLGLALLGASMLLSGCLTNKVGVRHDGTLAIALYEEGQYSYQMGTEKPEASDIYVTDPQGSTLKRLTYGDELKAAPVWSPDGRWIAYIAYHLEQPPTSNSQKKEKWELWVIGENGEEPRRLYETSRRISGVIWSPRGWEVAFWEPGSGTDGAHYIIVDVFTGEPLYKLDLDTGHSLTWSPHGDQVLYVDKGKEVFLLDLNTGSRKVLFEGFEEIYPLTWLKDGRLILAGKETPDSKGAIFLYDITSQSLTTTDIPFGSFEEIYSTNWLQDGRLIFTGGVETPESKPTIYTYNLASRTLAILRTGASHVGVSPSGQRLLMFVETAEKEGSPVLVTRRLDGVGGDEVVAEEGMISYAFWISDELVGYLYVTEKGESLKVVNLASGDSVNLTQRLKEWF